MIRVCSLVLSLLAAVAAVACADERTKPRTQGGAAVVAHVDAGPAALKILAPQQGMIVDVPHLDEPLPSQLDREMLSSGADDLVDHKAFGVLLLQQGDARAAVVELRKALAVDSSADTWTLLGDAYLRLGTNDSALPCLLEAVSLDVDQLSARRLLTRHFLSINNAPSARAHAEEWVRLQPQDPGARQALGRSLTQSGMWREAIEQFVLVVALQPDNAYAYNNLGFAALQLGDNERAAHSLERVLSLKPQQGYMLNNLGVAYERLGRTAFAHAAFARAAELSPRYAQAPLNRDRLQTELSHAQRIVSADALLKLRDGLFDDVPPLGTGPADSVDIPALPSTGNE